LGWVRPVRSRIAELLGMTSWEVQTWMIENIRPWVERFDAFVVSAAKNTVGLFADLFFFLLVLFFLFRDGPDYYKRLKDLLPLEAEYQEKLFTRINYSLHVILRGWFLSAILQGGASMLGFTLVGLPGAALLGLFAACASIIPFAGTSLVWGPAVMILMIQGAYGKGLFLLAWGVGMVSLIDNIAAPWLMGERINMPLPFLLFAILGGVALFGFKGLILGPLIVSIAPTLLQIYKERFLSRTSAK
jgi:predicted PurR-regulated permease PerM